MRILIVRLGSLGDLVHTLPAAAALRRGYPGAAIDWLVEARYRPFVALVPAVNETIAVEPSVGGWLRARRRLRARRYDAAIDFQGLLKSAALARLSGARRVVGFAAAHLRERAAAPWYTERHAPPAGGHVIAKNLALAAALGAPAGPMEFPLRSVDSPVAREARRAGRFALLNPGAAWPNKRWPPERFGELARRLRARCGLRSIVTWGEGEEPLARRVVEASDGAAAAAPPTDLGDLLALVRAAALVVSGDTGPLHLAAAAGAPVVGLYGPTDPRRNGPWAPDDIVVSRYEACGCHFERRCRFAGSARGRWCLQDMGVDEVWGAVEARLARAGEAVR
jgi:lipopolysaccharide heptosyltransferase I